MKATRLHLYLLGSFRLERDSQPIQFPTRKVEALLAYLVLHPEAHAREKLAALFWGDVPDEQARGSLRKALTLLRQPLGAEIVLADRQSVQLNPDYPLWVDARQLRTADFGMPIEASPTPLTKSDIANLQSKIDLYRGDLLADFYDDWILPLREHYRASYLETALRVIQQLRTASEYAHAIDLAHKVLLIDPANERLHQHLMFCHLASGDRNAALKQYEVCRRVMEAELGVEPLPETTALYRWIEQAPLERLSNEASITNLPIPVSSFIGREREMAEVKHLLITNATRLISLTGPGGSGKTRLSIQVATDLIDVFPDGVWWVELAPSTDEAHVVPAIAKTLGVCETPDEPLLDGLIRFLRPRHLLLVLDNCEHVIATCASMSYDLLSHAPQLKILATSREALGITGEQVFPTPALSLPQGDASSLADLLMQFEGIRLFVERAQALQPAFALSEHNAACVARICMRLDGIPLAIELAATQVKMLPAEDINERLNDRFNLLAIGRRVAPARHQTLRAVLDWSYDLLVEDERVLFRRLAVFAGGFTLKALERVTGTQSLHVLSRLVDKSLVTITMPGDKARYSMLETIREYAREKLEASDEAGVIRDHHLATYVELAERAEIKLRGAEQIPWLEQLDAELDNLRTALEWSLARDVQQGFRLAGALVWYWNLRAYWHEGPVWLTRLLDASNASARTQARAKALVALGNLTFWGNNDYPSARAYLEESVSIYRELAEIDHFGLAYALSLLSETLDELGEATAAQRVSGESLSLAQQLGVNGKWVYGWALLGKQAEGHAQRRDQLEQSARLFRELGDQAQLSVVLARLAWFYLSQKELALAQTTLDESMYLTRLIGDKMGLAWLRKLTGDLALAQADLVQAASHHQTALAQFKTLGSKLGIAETLMSLGRIRSIENDAAGARVFWEEACALAEVIQRKDMQAWLLDRLGHIAFAQADAALAMTLFQEALRLYHELDYQPDAIRILEDVSALWMAHDEPARALYILSAVQSLSSALGVTRSATDQERFDQTLAAARSALGARAEEIWVQGQSLTLEQTLDLARQASRSPIANF